jgi:DNA uptake protein ComE-like DNA-binding protein
MFSQSNFSNFSLEGSAIYLTELLQTFVSHIRTWSVVEYIYATGLLIGVLSTGYGVVRLASSGPVEYQAIEQQVSVTDITPSVAPALVVEVAGAVEQPGVYTLPIGSRVSQALQAAGNIKIDADQLRIAKEINLAEELKDQQKIYIPYLLDSLVNSSVNSSIEKTSQQTPDSSGANNSGGISINTASLKQLMELEGIGEKRAESISSGRPYTSVDELVSRKIITEAMLAKIKDTITL